MPTADDEIPPEQKAQDVNNRDDQENGSGDCIEIFLGHRNLLVGFIITLKKMAPLLGLELLDYFKPLSSDLSHIYATDWKSGSGKEFLLGEPYPGEPLDHFAATEC